MMWPEWAAAGTVNTRPTFAWRSFERGEVAVIRAPALAGNATSIPLFRPAPSSSSVPWVETWWGFPLQSAVGMQLTLVMRTLFTWRPGRELELLDDPEEDPLVVLPPVRPGAVPPAFAAEAGAGTPESRQRRATALAAVRDARGH
jgi:hypothetical protein